MLRDVSMTPFNYLPANQASLFSLARPTKKPESLSSGNPGKERRGIHSE
jgi:hypothetical protein